MIQAAVNNGRRALECLQPSLKTCCRSSLSLSFPSAEALQPGLQMLRASRPGLLKGAACNQLCQSFAFGLRSPQCGSACRGGPQLDSAYRPVGLDGRRGRRHLLELSSKTGHFARRLGLSVQVSLQRRSFTDMLKVPCLSRSQQTPGKLQAAV